MYVTKNRGKNTDHNNVVYNLSNEKWHSETIFRVTLLWHPYAGLIMQQDNEPICTSKLRAKGYLNTKEVRGMVTVTNSPALNNIEHFWVT